MSPKRRSKKSPECRSRMSLLTGSRVTLRGVCHNDSEVEGGAAEEGLANDTRADRTRDVRQGHRRGDGGSSAHGESRAAAGWRTGGPAAGSAQEQARPLSGVSPQPSFPSTCSMCYWVKRWERARRFSRPGLGSLSHTRISCWTHSRKAACSLEGRGSRSLILGITIR